MAHAFPVRFSKRWPPKKDIDKNLRLALLKNADCVVKIMNSKTRIKQTAHFQVKIMEIITRFKCLLSDNNNEKQIHLDINVIVVVVVVVVCSYGLVVVISLILAFLFLSENYKMFSQKLQPQKTNDNNNKNGQRHKGPL